MFKINQTNIDDFWHESMFDIKYLPTKKSETIFCFSHQAGKIHFVLQKKLQVVYFFVSTENKKNSLNPILLISRQLGIQRKKSKLFFVCWKNFISVKGCWLLKCFKLIGSFEGENCCIEKILHTYNSVFCFRICYIFNWKLCNIARGDIFTIKCIFFQIEQ